MAGMTHTGTLQNTRQRQNKQRHSPGHGSGVKGKGHLMHKMYFTKYISRKSKKPHLALNCNILNTCFATGCCPCLVQRRHVKGGRRKKREIHISVYIPKISLL